MIRTYKVARQSHSTFSGAAATVLALVVGSDQVNFSVGCDAVPEVARKKLA